MRNTVLSMRVWAVALGFCLGFGISTIGAQKALAQSDDLAGKSVSELLDVEPENTAPKEPPYQQRLEKLSNALGALHYLRALCANDPELWRNYMDNILEAENPDKTRRAKLVGAFNKGYQSYARLHRRCTDPARLSMRLHIDQAEAIAQDIQTRFAE